MTREIAYSLDGMTRLVERNFWFTVEQKTYRGWRKVSNGRDLAIETKLFLSFVREPSCDAIGA
jgi:hypothetical protein